MSDSYSFSGRLSHSDNKLWGAHIIVPDAITQVFLAQGVKRVVCILAEQHEYQCALLPKGDGRYLVMVNKKLRDTLRLRDGTPVAVTLRRDDSEYGLPMPEEFAAILEDDAEGCDLFEALTPGKKRTLLHIVQSVKNPDLRIERGLAIVEHLKSNQGKIDYRALADDLKRRRS